MILRFFILVTTVCLLSGVNPNSTLSKGKQQKYFPTALQKKNVYLGMSLEKFKKKVPRAIANPKVSEFKIEYTEVVTAQEITSYRYLFTQTALPELYSIEIVYKEMDNVLNTATQLLGTAQQNGEWRIPAKNIKEDFMMGAWTFGHRLVYGATLKNSEWENGFQTR